MAAKNTPSMWTRLRWVFTGRPVSHEEAEAARARPVQDPMTQTQLNMRDQRYSAGGFGL